MAPDPDAPAVLKLHPNGTAVLEIEDHEGEVLDYSPEPAAVRPDADGVVREAWAVTLRRLDGQAGPYRVSRTHAGRMRCDCADTVFGRAKREFRACKHRYSLDNVMRFAQRITSMAKAKPDEQTPARAADQVPASPEPRAQAAPPPAAPKVYAAIGRVQQALSRDGIGKNRRNQGQGFDFRGIDDVMNALSGPLVEAGLLILPRVLSRQVSERATAKGGTLFAVVVEVAYDFVCVGDGSRHTVVMHGEAMDSGDKATNKALSAAYKYACFQAFCIPTEGTPDADDEGHEVAPDPRRAAQQRAEAGPSFNEELKARDAALARDGLAAAGELRRHVKGQIDLAGAGADQAAVARAAADDFESRARRPKAG